MMVNVNAEIKLLFYSLSIIMLLFLLSGCFNPSPEMSSPPDSGYVTMPEQSNQITSTTPLRTMTIHPTPTNSVTPGPTKTPSPERILQTLPNVRGINIGNALDAPRPGEWGVDIEEALFNVTHEVGFNAVRIPVRFSAHTGPGPEYEINEAFFDLVDQAITWGLEKHTVVILDLHHFDEIKHNPHQELDHFYAIWSQVSKRYQAAPLSLYFELLNEPSHNLDSETWNEMIKTGVQIIRRTNPIRKIIIGGINYYEVNALQYLQLPNDNNLIATFHFYEPFQFTHQGASWVDGAFQWRGTTWDGTPSEMEKIRAALDIAVEWSYYHQIPIIVGEFGVIKGVDPDSRERWTRFIVQEASQRGINWFYWELCSEFGIYDCKNEVWDKNLLDALMAP